MTHPSVVYVDIDDTLANWDGIDVAIGSPKPEVVRHVRGLYAAGTRIVIWTCRTNVEVVKAITGRDETFEEMCRPVVAWLEKHKIPYDEIERTPKPLYDYLLDDRTLHPAELLRNDACTRCEVEAKA